MKLTNEACISFLQASGWLAMHDNMIITNERNKTIDNLIENYESEIKKQNIECEDNIPFLDIDDIILIASRLKI